jgi:CRISPR-associated protein Csd2
LENYLINQKGECHAEEDLDHVFDALKSMFEHDRSAARGEMASRRVIAFKHSSALGNAPAHELFDRVTVQRRFRGDLYVLDDDKLDNAPPARRYPDYEVSVRRDGLPEGIEIINVL